jgi:exopolysaccharide biosynthesis operon protein EpsL
VRSRGRLRRRALGLGHALLAAAALAASPAFALWRDKLTPFVEQKVTRDDNVFRASSPTADTYSTTSLGFTLDAPVSRQRFQAGYTWNATRYSQLSDLDFNGHDARAIWVWQVGNDLSGQLGYTDNFALAPFQYTQTRTPDPLRTRTAFLNAAQLLTPRWRIQSGAGVFDQKNGDPNLQLSDIRIASGDASISYVTPANSSIGLSGRLEGGRYPNRDFAAGIGLPFDDSYRQTSVGFIGDWTVTGVSRLAGRVARLSRRYPNTPQSDFDGNIAVLEYDWKVTGKLTLTGVVRRDISPFQDIQSSAVLVRGATVRPTLRVSEKIDLSAVLDYSIWDFLGDPGLVAGGALGRVDRVRSATASISYKPLRSVTLQASVLREVRTSNTAGADYTVNVGTVTARLSF